MANKLKYKWLLLLCFAFVMQANAQKSVSVKIDTNIMLIGDQVKVTFEAILPMNYSGNFPLFTDTIIGKLEIIDIYDMDTVIKDDLMQIKQEYLVTSFDSGWYSIPPIVFPVLNNDTEEVDSLLSAPVYFGVITMPIDTANADAIADINAPIEAPITMREILPFAGIGLGILLILFLAYYLYMRFARKEPIFVRKEKPKEPAHLIAFRELDSLKDKELWQQGRNKEYYSQLTDIIRNYLDDRFGIYAMEMTTDEIIGAISVGKVLDKEVKNDLFDVLTQADFVKFAKASTLANENEKYLRFAYDFVIKTKVAEQLADETSEQANPDNSKALETK